ncbi:MAG: hypothetical protein KDB22_20515, partial [Planctomycetales bacterium]|nr:hypothetical protein [Planctomycetales bacterium]
MGDNNQEQVGGFASHLDLLDALRGVSSQLESCLQVIQRLTSRGRLGYDANLGYHDLSTAKKFVLYNLQELAKNRASIGPPEHPNIESCIAGLEHIVILTGSEYRPYGMPEPRYKDRLYATGHEAAWKIVNDFLLSILLIADRDRAEVIADKGYEFEEVKIAVGEGILAVCSWLSGVQPFEPHTYRSHMRQELQLLESLKGGDRAPPQSEKDGEEDKNCKGKQADDALPGMGQGDSDNPPDPGGSPDASNPFVRLLQEFRNAYLEFDGWTPPLLGYTYDERSRSKRIQSGRIEVLACVSWPRADATKDDYEFFVATESNDAVRPMRDRFKQLSTLAGASLPVVIRDSIREVVSPGAEPLNPLEWWIVFLWFHNPPEEKTLDWADELTEGHWAIWDDPFLASIEAIERCGLHIGEIKFPAAVPARDADDEGETIKPTDTKESAQAGEASESQCRLTVESWSKLAIGVGEDGYWAIDYIPDVGSVFPKERAAKLDLPGDRWKNVLKLLANSPDGQSALKRDLFIELGYLSSAVKVEDIDDFRRDDGAMTKIKS